jgi:hypothetical protein
VLGEPAAAAAPFGTARTTSGRGRGHGRQDVQKSPSPL